MPNLVNPNDTPHDQEELASRMATPHADLIQARRLSDRQPAMDIQRLGLGVRGPLTLPAPAPTHACTASIEAFADGVRYTGTCR